MSEQRVNERAEKVQASRVGAWLDHHGYSIVASLGRLLRKPWATLLTVGVMAVALALPLGLWLVLGNMARLGGEVRESRDIAVFLKMDVDAAKAEAVAASLRARSDVAKVERVTPDQALEQLRARPDLAEAIDALGPDAAQAALPSVLRVSPKGDELLLADSLKTLPEAERVQHDAVWRERLDAWLRFGGRAVLVLAALLGLGAWYGLAAGALALGVLTVAWMALRQPLADLAAEYGSSFALRGLDPLPALCVLVGAGLLGWLGAGLVTGHYLRQTRPVER